MANQFLLARLLGPSQAGLFNLTVSLTTLVEMAAVLGMDQAVVRSIGAALGRNDRQGEMGVLPGALVILAVSMLLIAPFYWLGRDFLGSRVFGKPEMGPIVGLLALSVPFSGLGQVFLSYLIAYKRVKVFAAINQVLEPVTKVGLTVAGLLLLGRSPELAAAAFLAAAVIAFLPSAYYALQLYHSKQQGIIVNMAVRGELFGLAAPFLFNNLALRLNDHTETLVLGGMSNLYQLGIYTVCLRAMLVIQVIGTAINQVFAPFIAELYERGDLQRLEHQVQAVTRWTLILALPVGIGIFIFSAQLVVLLGPGFEPATWVLRLIILTRLAAAATATAANLLFMTRYQRLSVVNAVITVLFSFLLDFALIPRYGALGAALSGGVMIVFLSLLRLVEVRWLLHIQPWHVNLYKPLLAVVLGGLAGVGCMEALPAGQPLLEALVGGSMLCLVYGVSLLLLGLEAEDRQALGKAAERWLDPRQAAWVSRFLR